MAREQKKRRRLTLRDYPAGQSNGVSRGGSGDAACFRCSNNDHLARDCLDQSGDGIFPRLSHATEVNH